jgi:hypothetical protein
VTAARLGTVKPRDLAPAQAIGPPTAQPFDNPLKSRAVYELDSREVARALCPNEEHCSHAARNARALHYGTDALRTLNELPQLVGRWPLERALAHQQVAAGCPRDNIRRTLQVVLPRLQAQVHGSAPAEME